jgi:hypothetical protein
VPSNPVVIEASDPFPHMYSSEKHTVDMAQGSYKVTNTQGWPRDAGYFWQEYSKQNPEAISETNLNLIERGRSPLVDEQWIKAMPKHANAVLGEEIHHHHINGGRYATPVPKSLHTGGGFTRFNHWFRYAPTEVWKAANINTLGKTNNILSGGMFLMDAYKIAVDHPFAMTNQIYDFDNAGVTTSSGGPILANKLYSYFCNQGVFLIQFHNITQTGDYKGTIYDSFTKDPSTGRWTGVGVVNHIQSEFYPER